MRSLYLTGSVVLGALSIISGCSAGSVGDDAANQLSESLTCSLGVAQALGDACGKANTEVAITGSAIANATPPLVQADGSAYGVRFVEGATNEAALRFQPLQTTNYNFYLGAPNVPFRVVGPNGVVATASCTSAVTSIECNKLRKVSTVALTAGVLYRLEFGPTTAARYARLFIQTRVEPVATCGADDLTTAGAACQSTQSPSTKLPAAPLGATVAPATVLDRVYTATLPTTGPNTFGGGFDFTPDTSGSYELFLGTPKIPLKVSTGASPVQPTCSRGIPSSECTLLRRGDRLSLIAGTTYRFELGPNVNTSSVRFTIRRSVAPDECALNTDNCDDAPNACVNTDSGFNCVCPAGFTGDGIGPNGCTPPDECALNTDNCDDAPNACVNTDEGFNCVCPAGFSGPGVGPDGCLPDGVTSSQSAYLLPVADGVLTRTILTVGDSPNTKPDGVTPYTMVGIPDGLGAFDNGDGTFTMLSNHELVSTVGVPREHGGIGAFVSRWTVRKSDLHVLHGEDLIHQVALWNGTSYDAPVQGVTFGRFCSADLPAQTALFNASTGLGYNSRLFMDGEEIGTEGRSFAHELNGTSWQLPRLGKMAFENAVASPKVSDNTVVVSMDDGQGGQVYVYKGLKTNVGSPVDKAGLTNGELFGIRVPGVLAEDPATGIPTGPFELAALGNVENLTGLQVDQASVAQGATTFQRPEDGSWDPANPNDFYFVTTASFTGNSRLWRLRFIDAAEPTLGGTIEMLLDGSEGQKMLDNISVDSRGHIMLCEDVGNNAHVGRVFRYDIATDALTVVASHDPERFSPGGASFLTQDEETSGVIDASALLGNGWWLIDVQAHFATTTEAVEGGQYLAFFDPASAN